jgi:hypothetical protein
MHSAVLLALLGTQGRQELLVVVRVHPYATWGRGSGVDEELVALLWVEATDPAWREGPHLVFHGATAVGRDAVTLHAVTRAIGGDT